MELSDLSKKKKNSLTEKFTPITESIDHNHENVSLTSNTPLTLEQNGSTSNGIMITPTTGDNSKILEPGTTIRPVMDDQDAESLVERLYGITVQSLKELLSYDDRNYLIQADSHVKNPILNNNWPHGYVLKILNSLDSEKPDFIEAQTELMLFLGKEQIICPNPIKNINGNYYSIENLNAKKHIVRLLEYIPGEVFHQVPKTNHIYYQAGEYVAKLDTKLKKFNHEAYATHKSLWHLQSVPRLKEFLYVIKDLSRKDIVEQVISSFELNVLPKLSQLEKGVIHGDFNEQNILVHIPKGEKDYRISGILDFGDTSFSPLIFELAIAIMYMIIQSKDLETAGLVIAGYSTVRNITQMEKEILKICVAGRLCQSVVLGTYTHSQDPDNTYLLTTQEAGWTSLESLWRDNLNKIDEIWQNVADKYLTQSVK